MDKDYGRGKMEKEGYTYKTLMVAGMHFMDSYNYDIERVKRCVIHYAAPNGLIYPFCALQFRSHLPREDRAQVLHALRPATGDAGPGWRGAQARTGDLG